MRNDERSTAGTAVSYKQCQNSANSEIFDYIVQKNCLYFMLVISAIMIESGKKP